MWDPRDTLEDATLEYIEQGRSIIPIVKGTKLPPENFKVKQYRERFATPDEVAWWFKQWPDAQIAMITGQLSGIVAVDGDNKEGLAWMKKNLPRTPVYQKTCDGYHSLYKTNGQKVKNKSDDKYPPVHVRGDGGYILIAPSTHSSGQRYELVYPIEGQGWGDLPDFPHELFNQKTTDDTHKEPTTKDTFFDEVTGDRSHDALLKYAGRLIAKGISREETLEILRDVIRTRVRADKQEKRLSELPRMIDTAIEKYAPDEAPPDINPMDAIINNCVKRGYVAMLGDEHWLFKNLIIKNQITVIIAKAGGGKTTIFYDFVAPNIIRNHGVKVFFMDCDSPASDHKRMFKIAEQNGDSFYWLNPITHGKNADFLIENLKKMVKQKTRLDNIVFFMDTLKKFLNVMSKGSTKPFYELLRQMISLGATIVLLGHANKYRDGEGNLVFEGVGDILSDADALIYFESVKAIGGGDDVTTVVDRDKGAKIRGLYEPISFHIAGDDRTVTQHKDVVPAPDYSPIGRKERLPDDEIMDEIRKLLRNKTGRMNQSNIVEALKANSGIPYHRLLRVIRSQVVVDKEAITSGTVYFFHGERGTKFYDVVE